MYADSHEYATFNRKSPKSLGSVTSNLPRVAIVGTKWPTLGHKSLSSIDAGFYI